MGTTAHRAIAKHAVGVAATVPVHISRDNRNATVETYRLFIRPADCGFTEDDSDKISDEPHLYLELRSGYLYLTSLYIPTRMRGRGMATALMLSALEYQRWNRKWPIYLAAHPFAEAPMDQAKLFEFYARFGFVRTPEHPFSMCCWPKPISS